MQYAHSTEVHTYASDLYVRVSVPQLPLCRRQRT